MRADSDIQRDVELEIRYDAAIESHDLGVSVRNRIVILTGIARSDAERSQAEHDAKRVAGVAAIANALEVKLPSPNDRPASDLAQEVLLALARQIPAVMGVMPIVQNGEVILEGEVAYRFQKEEVEEAVRRLRGVRSVANLIQVKPRSPAEDIKARIENALARSAEVDAAHIQVESEGEKVILKGIVRTQAEKEEAERAAWRARGVAAVENRLLVGDPALLP